MISFGISKRLPCGFDTWLRPNPASTQVRIDDSKFAGQGMETLVSKARFYKFAGLWFGYCISDHALPIEGSSVSNRSP